MDLAQVADELYGLALGDFIAARTQHVKDAKAAGDKELAAQIGKLPKPSTSAWAVNTLGRQAPDELDRVLDLGGALREAQEALDGDELRELTRQRQALIAELVGRTRAETRAAGHPITDPVAEEVEQTLRAAMADEGAAAAVRTRQLTAAISASGGGILAAPTGTGAASTRAKKPAARKATPPDTSAADAAAEAERVRLVEQAQRAVEEASARADEAEDTVSDRQHLVDDAADRREDALVAMRELEEALRQRTEELATVDAELATVRAQLETAQQASRDARAAADEAADLLAARRAGT